MNILQYIKGVLLKIKWWILIVPPIVGAIAFIYTLNMPKTYKVRSEIYTGIVSNPSPATEGIVSTNWNVLMNALDNLMNIIKSPTTLKMVSLRLLAQDLVHGDSEKDNEYITAEKYIQLQNIMPKEILELVDKSSEQKTFEKLLTYQEATNINSLNTLLNGNMPYYSIQALSKVEATRIGLSDMIELKYESDDPGISFYTLSFLYEEFVNQYDKIRYDQLKNTISFFEQEAKERRDSLNISEANLISFQREKGIINFDLQTQSNIALNEALSSRHQEALMAYNSSMTAVKELDRRIDQQAKSMKNSKDFLIEKDAVTELSYRVAKMESLGTSSSGSSQELNNLKQELSVRQNKLRELSNSMNMDKYSRDGLPIQAILDQWIQESLNVEKAKAELDVIKTRKGEIVREGESLLPYGSLLKQQGRDITTDEATYLALIDNLNSARLRLKSLQLSGPTMAEITPPTYPTESANSKRTTMILFAVIFSALFVIGYFFVRELLSRKMNNRLHTERLTGQKVLGVYPKLGKNAESNSKTKRYMQLANKYLGNRLSSFFKPRKQNIINLISINNAEGTELLSTKIEDSLGSSTLKTKIVSYTQDYSPTSREYLLANDISEIYTGNEEVIITNLPPLVECAIPEGLLNKAAINLFVISAGDSWKYSHQAILDELVDKAGSAPLYIYINNSSIDVFKEFAEIRNEKV